MRMNYEFRHSVDFVKIISHIQMSTTDVELCHDNNSPQDVSNNFGNV